MVVTEFTDNNNSNVFYVETAHESYACIILVKERIGGASASARVAGFLGACQRPKRSSQPATHKYRMPLPQFTGTSTSRLLSI